MPVKLDPPPPANSKQPGVTTTLLYNGSRFQGHQKSKGNCYDVEVILQVRNCQIKTLQNIWLVFWFISIYELYELWWIFLIRYLTKNNDMRYVKWPMQIFYSQYLCNLPANRHIAFWFVSKWLQTVDSKLNHIYSP